MLDHIPHIVFLNGNLFQIQLGERLVQLVPTSGVDVVELEEEGTCVRFSPLLTAAGRHKQRTLVVEF